METEAELMFAVVIVLACAVAIYFVGKKIRMPLLIGYFLTGIVVGPFGLGLVSEEQVSMLSEFGIILLMFTIGLEISLKNLLSMKKIVLIGGTLQLVLTTAVVFGVMMFFGFAWNTSLLIGFLVAHSSTAIIMNIYQKSGEIDTQHGKISLGLLIFQDLNVVPMMMLVPLIAGTAGTSAGESVLSFIIGMIIVVLILLAAVYIVPRFLKRIVMTRNSELFVISIVIICFGTAWIMSLNGVSLALGAFLAGVAISGSDYNHEVLGLIMPVRDILTSFFFVSIGMMLDMSYLLQHMFLIVGLAFALLAAKTVINFISVKMIGVVTSVAMLSAIGLSQIGEFSFILGATGYETGILTESVYQVFLAISIITMALTPLMVSAGKPVITKLFAPKIPCDEEARTVCTVFDSKNKPDEHVIIVGYGLAGRYVAKALKKVGMPYIIIEMNSDTVTKERANGENIIYGDAGREGVLEYAGIMSASSIVVSIPNMEAVKAIISTSRRLNPKVAIISRSRFISETTELYRIGADEVIVDEREAAIQIFKRILRKENVPEQDIALYSSEVRYEMYNKYIDAEAPVSTEFNKKSRLFGSVISKAKHVDDSFSKNMTAVEQLRVEPGCFASNKKLSDIHMRGNYGVSVVAIKRKDSSDAVVSPDGDTVIFEGDTVVVIGDRSAIVKTVKLFISPKNDSADDKS